MVKFLVLSAFRCFEYAIVFLFIASIAFALAQGLGNFVPEAYTTLAEEELTKAVKDGFESKQITSQQAGEIFRIYRSEQARLQKRRTHVIYAVSICVSAGLMVVLFKKYRSLRFRERFGDYFFQAKT